MASPKTDRINLIDVLILKFLSPNQSMPGNNPGDPTIAKASVDASCSANALFGDVGVA
jgi:hypothetical protein